MIKLSTIIKLLIDICTFIMLRYFLILPSGEPLAPHVMRIVVVIIACVLFLLTGFACKSIGETRKYYEWINGYIPGYLITVAVCSVYTFFRYSFSVQNLLHAITPFLFVILAYPLIYIFICDGGIIPYIKRCVVYECIILLCKAIGWYLYNYTGGDLFTNLVLEFGVWVRDGIQRVEVGQLFGLAFVFVMFFAMKTKQKKWYGVSIFMVISLAVISMFRFQMAAVALTAFVMLFFASEHAKRRFLLRSTLIICVVLFLFSSVFADIVDSAALDGTYGSSTLVRLENAKHYFRLLKENDSFLGLGLLIESNSNTYRLMYRNQWKPYYLDDIGILGGVVRFGIGTIFIYGVLFYKMIKTLIRSYYTRKDTDFVLLLGLTTYIVFSCIFLNVFDWQRAYAVPFYLGIYSYLDARMKFERGKISEEVNNNEKESGA